MSPQITCASALPVKMGASEVIDILALYKSDYYYYYNMEITFFTQWDCVTHTTHLCAVFLKEKIVICDVFDSV